MKKAYLILYLLSVLLGPFSVIGQSINSRELSADQAQLLMKRAQSMGYSSSEEILEFAKKQGLSEGQTSSFSSYLDDQNRLALGSGDPQRKITKYDTLTVKQKKRYKQDSIRQLHFGYSFFSNAKFSGFESLNNLPTPQNYVIGSGDELYVDIYGKSEQYYKAQVTPEGYIVLKNFGPINVAGSTLSEVTTILKSRLSKTYRGLLGSNPDTHLQVSLGNTRSVQVNIAGEVVTPGTYFLNSYASILNALYIAGGPTLNGTMREIEIYRNNKLEAIYDFYEYLTSGKSDGNIFLKDNDIIIIKPQLGRVELAGEVKRTGFFEIIKGETVNDVLEYAGSFTEKAYTSRLKITRNTDKERTISDIYREQFEIFELKSGDVLEIGEILERYTNRVQIKGAVYRPGAYAFTDGLTVQELLDKADGPTGDAFLGRVLITRTNDDLTTSTLSVGLNDIISGNKPDIPLVREDILWVQSIFDLRETQLVEVSGEVNLPGTFPYSEGMTVTDLVFLAGGLSRGASPQSVEIARRIESQTKDNQTELISISISEDLLLENGDQFVLLPFDHVMVRKDPNFFPERIVNISGEIVYPGSYTLTKENERISDLIERAGGLRELGYPEGATLIRRTEFFDEANKRMTGLESLLNKIDTTVLSEGERRLREKLILEMENQDDSTDLNLSVELKKQRLFEIASRDSLALKFQLMSSEMIPLNLEDILSNPGTPGDFILEDGDILNVPKKKQTVRLRGKVLYATTVKYEKGRRIGYFIAQAGGFADRAKKRKTYVVHANGEADRTRQFLFFRFYPKVEPGSEIIVPAKEARLPFRPSEIVGITSSLVTLALVINQFSR